ncbi:hypothetical protein PCASD_21572 [Puccinia coronata f. sp. avenae]|uniref:Uncharacterized protein n=1 Tax=Puccinia coronata f. sp. avenae TaxID=200324 RepID=A0A2N5UHB1_9BASI|nr:hypothetical protein PCASD_21572 [Puccinia coronata f. sp. avenae]
MLKFSRCSSTLVDAAATLHLDYASVAIETRRVSTVAVANKTVMLSSWINQNGHPTNCNHSMSGMASARIRQSGTTDAIQLYIN